MITGAAGCELNKAGSGTFVGEQRTLEAAMPLFESTGAAFLPVVRLGGEGEAPELLGTLHHVDALRAYNRALADTAAEEHA